ncbi:phage major capsid protein [Candidatus Bathyarchaeota archaeon A05DMB-2]|jgi:HK97 family phage major capsid protein|nr:phage major capsid protein [Candidatus Bathyarchaeota archaeon A05DMB-2]
MKPKLFESLMQKDNEFKLLVEKVKERAVTHPFLKRYMEVGVKEGLFSDMTGALGRMHDTLIEAAYPELIGRNIINVKQTTEPLERFPLDEKAVAYNYAEGAITRLSGKKTSTVDIQTNTLAESSEEWTREFAEDATWNVMDNMIEKVGRALGENETTKILSLYGAIADADLAGGAPIAGGGAALSWNGLLKLHNAVRGENWRPTVLAVHETQLHQLLNDDKFIHAQYLPAGQTDVEQGLVTSVLGMRVQASTLVPNGTAYAIDTRVAAVMLLRRDVTVEDWQDAKTGEYGVRATTRFGLGVLRSKAVAKMTNISTSL